MGFNDQEIVALSGAHALGRCHTDRSGYWGPWTRAETTMSNEYYRELIENKWTPKKMHHGQKWTGPAQYEDPTGMYSFKLQIYKLSTKLDHKPAKYTDDPRKKRNGAPTGQKSMPYSLSEFSLDP
jgi:hypothetical protein